MNKIQFTRLFVFHLLSIELVKFICLHSSRGFDRTGRHRSINRKCSKTTGYLRLQRTIIIQVTSILQGNSSKLNSLTVHKSISNILNSSNKYIKKKHKV